MSLSRCVEWTSTEDHLLMTLVSHSKKWSQMQEHFPNRTVEGVRNRYLRLLRTHTRPPKQICRQCGAFRRSHICERVPRCKGATAAKTVRVVQAVRVVGEVEPDESARVDAGVEPVPVVGEVEPDERPLLAGVADTSMVPAVTSRSEVSSVLLFAARLATRTFL